MYRLILGLFVTAVLCFSQPAATNAQGLEIGGLVTTPQTDVGGLEGRTFGYGLTASVVHSQSETMQIVATAQYHNHSRAEFEVSGLGLIAGADRDLYVGGGIRLTRWNLYVEGTGGFIQKRDALIDEENNTVVGGYAGWGYQPGAVGIAGGWYFSEFGFQYGLGLRLRI